VGRIIGFLKESNYNILECGKISLDYDRFTEYLESSDHRSERLFEDPPISKKKRIQTASLDATIFSYFLDGSRRTYKIADYITPDGRYLPIVAGQIGVAVLKRDFSTRKLDVLRNYSLINSLIVFPDQGTNENELEELGKKITELSGKIFQVIRYKVKKEKEPVDLAIAKITSMMHDLELETVRKMTSDSLLSPGEMLVLDGSLEFAKKIDIVQFRNIVGISKSFRPSSSIGKGKGRRDVGALVSSLQIGERTPVYQTTVDRNKIGMWYLRIRDRNYMSNPLQGALKLECFAIDPDEQENGLPSDRVDTISACVLSERNVTPYGKDPRWANHLYPIYLTENYIKRCFMSDTVFEGLF